MDTRAEDRNDIIERALAREVPGELDPGLVARVEERLEGDAAGTTETTRNFADSLLPWLAGWIFLAAGIITVHIRVAPADYAVLAAALQSIFERGRLDLILAAAVALCLAEAAARLTGRDQAGRMHEAG